MYFFFFSSGTEALRFAQSRCMTVRLAESRSSTDRSPFAQLHIQDESGHTILPEPDHPFDRAAAEGKSGSISSLGSDVGNRAFGIEDQIPPVIEKQEDSHQKEDQQNSLEHTDQPLSQIHAVQFDLSQVFPCVKGVWRKVPARQMPCRDFLWRRNSAKSVFTDIHRYSTIHFFLHKKYCIYARFLQNSYLHQPIHMSAILSGIPNIEGVLLSIQY